MLLLFLAVFGIVVILDIRYFAKKNLKKEIILYSTFALITLVFGILYFSMQDQINIARWILEFTGTL